MTLMRRLSRSATPENELASSGACALSGIADPLADTLAHRSLTSGNASYGESHRRRLVQRPCLAAQCASQRHRRNNVITYLQANRRPETRGMR